MNFKTPIIAALLSGAGICQAQINYSGGTYLQSFDSLPTAATTPWADNTTVPGFYAFFSGTSAAPANILGGTGSANTGGLYSFGATGSSDRALGSLSSGTPQTITFGARFVNSSSFTFDSLTVSYAGEQWRDGGAAVPAAQTNDFAFLIGAPVLTLGSAGYTTVSQLGFTSPVFTNTASGAAVDGNVNRQVISFTIAGISWAPGQELFVRFLDINNAGNDHGLAVDDFSLTATQVPEPSAVILGVAGLAGLMALRRRRN